MLILMQCDSACKLFLSLACWKREKRHTQSKWSRLSKIISLSETESVGLYNQEERKEEAIHIAPGLFTLNGREDKNYSRLCLR